MPVFSMIMLRNVLNWPWMLRMFTSTLPLLLLL